MSGFGAMVPGGTALTLEAPTFRLPKPAAASPPADPEAPCRFAGEPLHWLRVPAGAPVLAFARATRRVFQRVEAGLPGSPATAATLIEVAPLPGFVAAPLRLLAGGLPVQYVLLNGGDLHLVAGAGEEAVVAAEEPLLTPESECWIGVCFQDRVCRDPRAWAAAIDTAAAAAGAANTAAWPAFVAAIGGSPRVRLLDHVGRPLQGGSFEIESGGSAQTVTLSGGSDGDSGVDVAVGAAQVSVPADASVVLASAEADRGEVGGPLSLTAADRLVLVTDVEEWLAPRSPGVTGMAHWTRGNEFEPIVDGIPYFARLVPELRAAKGGGAAQLAGWAFVKEGLRDPTKPWSLLPEDDSTEVVALLEELAAGGAEVRLLVNQFLQITGAELDTLGAALGILAMAAVVLLALTQAVHWQTTDPAGWALIGAALFAVGLVPDSALRDLLESLVEPSKSTVEAINQSHPGTAVMTPYPAAFADNPLVPHPLTIAGIDVEVIQHLGVYHQKIAMAQPPGGQPAAFVGGIDINSDRVDDPLHRAIAPFHDVQARLAGPAANEVAKTFAERATYHGTTAPIAPVDDSTTVAAVGSHLVQVGRTYFAPAPGSPSRPFPSAPQGEHTTHDTLVQAIDRAREYIYIEDQYFTPNKAYVDALVAAGDPARGVGALVVTLPERTDQTLGRFRRGDVINRLASTWGERLHVGTPLRRYLDPDPGTFGGLGRLVLRKRISSGDAEIVVGPAERVPTPPFWAFVESELMWVRGAAPGGPGTGPLEPPEPGEEPDPPDQTWQRLAVERGPLGSGPRWKAKADKHDKSSCVLAVQIPGIYVHAKLMVVDDVFVSIGSSNLNRRGLEHDGEVNAFAVPAHLKRDPANPALRLRCELWAEHLGLSPELGLSLLGDPISALPYFKRSWFRGSRWQALDFAAVSDPPELKISTAASVLTQLLKVPEAVALGAEQDLVWAALVDPTTANDPNVDPATDRGPHL